MRWAKRVFMIVAEGVWLAGLGAASATVTIGAFIFLR